MTLIFFFIIISKFLWESRGSSALLMDRHQISPLILSELITFYSPCNFLGSYCFLLISGGIEVNYWRQSLGIIYVIFLRNFVCPSLRQMRSKQASQNRSKTTLLSFYLFYLFTFLEFPDFFTHIQQIIFIPKCFVFVFGICD